ncbi:FAD-binding oxidoreductase [Reichenbachiella sp.]|uniref:FAD-binding oxidoreductase n=1 Tax=Reichenbachiella sp. TaxID=2184521 RepID=UPI003298667F
MISKAINELAQKLSGYVLQAGDAEYEAATQIDNGRIQLKPLVIVRPTVVEDVALGLKFAITHNLPFTIKGGGHSATGYCLNDDGVVMDMKHLNSITFNKDKQTAHVQMGVIWFDVYKFMADTGTGLVPIGGGCPTVAPPGFVLGGGYSFVSRSYGMSIDNILSMKIITPDGTLRHIGIDSKSKEDQDVFWACLGGGGGNFGIVVEMEMKVHQPKSEKMLVGQMRYHLEQAEEVLGYYNEWVETIPNEMAVYGFVGNQPDFVETTKDVKVLGLTPVFNGEYAEGLDLLQGLLKLKPINTDLKNMTLPDWEFFNGNTTKVSGNSAYIRSLILPKHGMNNDVAKVFIEYMSKAPSPLSFCVWTLSGGEIASRNPADTAFVHRHARFIPEVKSIWDADQPGDALKNVEWAYEFFEALGKAGGATGAYVNYIDPLLHDWPEKYYGENYARLNAIKKQVDPKNFFNFQQGIGSSFNPNQKLTDLSPLNRTIFK